MVCPSNLEKSISGGENRHSSSLKLPQSRPTTLHLLIPLSRVQDPCSPDPSAPFHYSILPYSILFCFYHWYVHTALLHGMLRYWLQIETLTLYCTHTYTPPPHPPSLCGVSVVWETPQHAFSTSSALASISIILVFGEENVMILNRTKWWYDPYCLSRSVVQAPNTNASCA